MSLFPLQSFRMGNSEKKHGICLVYSEGGDVCVSSNTSHFTRYVQFGTTAVVVYLRVSGFLSPADPDLHGPPYTGRLRHGFYSI